MLQPSGQQPDSALAQSSPFSAQPAQFCGLPTATAAVTNCWQVWVAQQHQFYQLCLQWLHGNQDDASDAFNQAALAVWLHSGRSAQTIANPVAWLAGLLRHTCLDLHRARPKSKRQVVALDNAEVIGSSAHYSSATASPEAVCLQREKYTYLHQAIDALPPRLRTVVILRFYQEHSYEAIATQLSLSLDNVYKRMQAARTLLVHKLQVYQAGLAGPDQHNAWPDDAALFQSVSPPVQADPGSADPLQPRVKVLPRVSKREIQKLHSLRAYVQQYPTGWKKRLALADQLCKLGYQTEALVNYEQVLAKRPRLFSVWLQVAQLYQMLGHNADAVAAYAQALPLADTPAVRATIVTLIEKVAMQNDPKVENFRNDVIGSTYK